ncbi:hypothetical protein AB5I39_01170 [Sphingomonas sp. MMS24-J45]|uniref:hypothetical protein n=1 Tax=Sphingomonas sp. MMS24-J45 TaxID=3238806 RepID=UPI00384E5FAE
MHEVYFHNDGKDHDVGNFVISLGDYQVDTLEDLMVVAQAGPEFMERCQDLGSGIWEYRRSLAPARYAILLFTFLQESNVYIVLHGFRAGREGTTSSDLRHAKQVAKAYR